MFSDVEYARKMSGFLNFEPPVEQSPRPEDVGGAHESPPDPPLYVQSEAASVASFREINASNTMGYSIASSSRCSRPSDVYKHARRTASSTPTLGSEAGASPPHLPAIAGTSSGDVTIAVPTSDPFLCPEFESPTMLSKDPSHQPSPTHLLQASEEEEMKAAFSVIAQQQQLLEAEGREIEMLEVTQRELASMDVAHQELAKNEYFNLNYFASQAGACWGERKADDAAATSSRTVRLFPTESAIAATLQSRRVLQEDRSLIDPNEMRMKHPQMYKRQQRDQERRELFARALADRGGVGSVPRIADISRSTISAPVSNTSTGGAVVAAKNKPPAAEEVSETVEQTGGGGGLPDSPAAAVAPPSPEGGGGGEGGMRQMGLKELLLQQRQMMQQLEHSDTNVYRPLLDAYCRYDEAVKAKLTALSAM